MDPANNDKGDILRAKRNNEKQFAFDYVFEPAASQEAVFMHTTKFLIHGVLDGYNATVFAYGQTGCGKTHTMMGPASALEQGSANEHDRGIIPRAVRHIFGYIDAADKAIKFLVRCSYLEIYNENILDLLCGRAS